MTRLGNINLFVRDIERARRFYTQVLGLTENTERSAPPSFYLLEAGDVTLTLQDAATPEADFNGGTSLELGFALDDVEAAAERLRAFGVETGGVQQMGWGTALDARDPDGHRITLYRYR